MRPDAEPKHFIWKTDCTIDFMVSVWLGIFGDISIPNRISTANIAYANVN